MAAQKVKRILAQSGAQMIDDMWKVHFKLDGATLAVQVAEVSKKTLNAQAED